VWEGLVKTQLMSTEERRRAKIDAVMEDRTRTDMNKPVAKREPGHGHSGRIKTFFHLSCLAVLDTPTPQ
jgi:hypothetical protein